MHTNTHYYVVQADDQLQGFVSRGQMASDSRCSSGKCSLPSRATFLLCQDDPSRLRCATEHHQFCSVQCKKLITKIYSCTHSSLTWTLISTLWTDNNLLTQSRWTSTHTQTASVRPSTHPETHHNHQPNIITTTPTTTGTITRSPTWPALAAQWSGVDPDLSSPFTDTLFVRHSSRNGKLPTQL